ncbi:MAG: competence protein ComFB [Spirochaetes bacterium]|nr:MAG: competence protein ComFB [Spirochaetota bacterium]
MKVHNLMEDIVIKTVNELFENKSRVKSEIADCLQCKMDVVCYVLNRIKPEYIISGRGLIHFEEDYHKKIQLEADIISIASEGIKKITEIQRPYYKITKEDILKDAPFFFNFPAILGQILNGKSFEPLDNVLVSLFMGSEPVRMIDNTWENPYLVVKSTRGNFSFMPRPVPAEEENEQRLFSMELRVKKEGFEELNHFFDLTLKSEKDIKTSYNIKLTYKTEPLYLFPEGDEESV